MCGVCIAILASLAAASMKVGAASASGVKVHIPEVDWVIPDVRLASLSCWGSHGSCGGSSRLMLSLWVSSHGNFWPR